MKLHLTLLILFLLNLAVTFGSVIEHEFNIKPQGSLETASFPSFSGQYKCIFNYVARGGSNEHWLVTISESNYAVSCNIGRPQPPSYILFQDFSISLVKDDKNLAITSTELWDNNGIVLLDDQYKVENNVIKPTKMWGGNLVVASLDHRL
ncbi:hypothetical protein DLAC_03263 [Tieghemostelium lacteum]|uniref:Uncharacterized protein n=1 Tax=Tieghemostelium lacteum TaxID=361077 RepID=A0A152A1N0_TIELA|nr:hypothetical protein DLAC_03263 [Tieghemostelium lacteum]|eukprot:KYR00114.1 hypothetical protein DLAC_03263 [Tieghemostelium lacteum]